MEKLTIIKVGGKIVEEQQSLNQLLNDFADIPGNKLLVHGGALGGGAGEIVVNSIDTDGVKQGFDLEMLEAVCNAVSVPVIASGGAGCTEDFIKLFKALPKVDAGLAASIFHFGEVKIPDLKNTLNDNNINVRLQV